MKKPRTLYADLNDLTELCAIEQKSFRTDNLTRKQFIYLLEKSSGSLFLKIRQEGELAGYIIILFRKNSSWCRVYSLAIAKKFQGRGLGRELIKQAINHARKRGLQGVRLEVRVSNRKARKLYKQMGFEDILCLPAYYEDNSDAMRMAYILSNQKKNQKKD